jgi:type III pantothenate kinase
MRLLIDVGNTRAKWALSDGHALRDHDVATHAQLAQSLQGYLAAREGVSEAIIANVAGRALGQLLQDVIAAHVPLSPRFLHSTRELCGVRNAYAAPERLGIDRLVAMVGARQLLSGPLCVACVGTAMTVDVIDGTGQHLGGLIVPGPQLMTSSLIENTSDIGPRAAQGERGDEVLADDTRGAIEQGAEQALVALIERVRTKLEARIGHPLSTVLTGGAADRLAHLVSGSPKVVPDLVLRGLAVVAEQSPL